MSPGEWEDLKDEVKALRTAVDELNRWKSWVLGVVAALGAIIAFMADNIKKRMGF